jgi:hypothetical protein
VTAEPEAAARPGFDAYVAASRQRSGVPRRVEDEDVLLAVAHRLLAAELERAGAGPAAAGGNSGEP